MDVRRPETFQFLCAHSKEVCWWNEREELLDCHKSKSTFPHRMRVKDKIRIST